MGGDHKCPVCQATFTRPQHVARHMRSHTGDRPYKCQHCGDQFARSDLLSRHVNKCHANEKPLPNTGARRKGAASASRATTSKQACDQCVQSSLPCDGCNPCSKCVSRKCRCTYVKFHRQTAPVGPGHNARSNAPPASAPAGPVPSSSAFSSSGPSSSRLLYQQSEDDFILGPAPSSVPTMAEALYNSNSFAFPPLYPSNDMNTLSDGVDYPTKFRTQQADLFGPGRSGLSTGLTPLYDPRQVTSTQGTSSWLGDWETQDTHNAYHQQQHSQRQAEFLSGQDPNASAMHDKHLEAELSHQPNATGHFIENSSSSNPGDNAQPITMSYAARYALPRLQAERLVARPPEQGGRGRHSSSSYGSSNSNSRRGSVDFSGSESASASGHASGSMPSSATSSSVHLPLGGVDYGNPTGYNSNIPDRNATSSPSSHSSQHRDYGRYASQDDRQEFSSAFGLMSLDDPAVMAGISVDGQPFFDDPSQAHNQHRSTDPEQIHDGLLTTDIGPDIDTPMPLRRDAGRIQFLSGRPATATGAASTNTGGSGTTFDIGNLPTPSKDVDARELKEFWKQYLRTPLTGPEGSNVGPSNKMPSPSSHRRQRVSSLPIVKTPMMERDDLFTHLGYHPSQQQDQRRGEKGAGVQQGPMSSLRTTLHAKEDLRSYEAAVLARKAPMLNLQLKRPVRATVPGPFPAPNQQGRNEPRKAKESQSIANPNVGFGSRPPSSAGHSQSSSFSFAQAFGEQANGSISMSSSATLSFEEESQSPSLASSRATSVDNSESESRPSFKRLASHTLGPENSKRAFFGYGDEMAESDNMVGWTNDPRAIGKMHSGGMGSGGVGQGMIHHLDRDVACIAERRRRSNASSIDALKLSHERGENSQS